MANEHIFKSGVVVSGSIETTAGFVGDGSGLSGITSLTVWNGELDGDASITGSLTVSSSTARVDFVDTAGVTGSFSGSFKGNGSELTNIDINGTTASNVVLSGTFTGNGSGLTGLEPFPYYGDAKITGSLIVSSSLVDLTDTTAISGSTFSGSFVGDGTGLSGLTASPAGANTEIQLNNSGTTGASSNLKYAGSTLIVSESIRIIKSGSGEIEITNNSGTPNVSLFKARGSGGTNMGTFLFQGSTPYGTTSDYMTLSSAVLDVTGALIKGGKISVGGYPVTTPTTAQGNLYVKRTVSASLDTIATFENTDSNAYGGGGFLDIVGNSNDYAAGGIRVKNGTEVDGEIYYAAGSRQIILHSNKRGISLNSSGLLYKNNNSTQFAIDHNGRVGIGTSSPAYKLDVNGNLHSTNITIADYIYHEGDTDTYMNFGADYWNVATGGIKKLEVFNTGVFVTGQLSINDKIGHTGDTDTYMRFPFNDTISWETAGSERMRITSTGNVGIGTSNPGNKLHIQGSETTVYSPTDSGGQESAGTAIVNKNLAGNTNNFSQLLFTVGTNNNSVSRIVAIRSASDASDLAFVGKSAAGVAEYMRIKSGGNVGIGTNNPQAKLDISSTTDGVLLPRLTQTQILNISSPATGLTLYNTTNNVLVYYNGTQWRALSSTAMIVPV